MVSNLYGFSELPEEVHGELAVALKEEVFEKGAVIVAEGEPADRMYIIETGIAEVSTVGAKGKVILGQLIMGDLFGEVALVSKVRNRKATVTALTPLVALSLDSESFERILGQFPEVLEDFVRTADFLLNEKLQRVSKDGGSGS